MTTLPRAIAKVRNGMAGPTPSVSKKMENDTRLGIIIGGVICSVITTVALAIGLGSHLIKSTETAADNAKVDRAIRLHQTLTRPAECPKLP